MFVNSSCLVCERIHYARSDHIYCDVMKRQSVRTRSVTRGVSTSNMLNIRKSRFDLPINLKNNLGDEIL